MISKKISAARWWYHGVKCTHPATKKRTNSLRSSSAVRASLGSSPWPASSMSVNKSFSLSSTSEEAFDRCFFLCSMISSKSSLSLLKLPCVFCRSGKKLTRLVSNWGTSKNLKSSMCSLISLYLRTHSPSGFSVALNSNPNPIRPMASKVNLLQGCVHQEYDLVYFLSRKIITYRWSNSWIWTGPPDLSICWSILLLKAVNVLTGMDLWNAGLAIWFELRQDWIQYLSHRSNERYLLLQTNLSSPAPFMAILKGHVGSSKESSKQCLATWATCVRLGPHLCKMTLMDVHNIQLVTCHFHFTCLIQHCADGFRVCDKDIPPKLIELANESICLFVCRNHISLRSYEVVFTTDQRNQHGVKWHMLDMLDVSGVCG